MVELYLSSEVSYQELALSQGISNPSLIVKRSMISELPDLDALRPKKKGRKENIGYKRMQKAF